MVNNINWIIPTLRKPSILWHIASSITFAVAGIFTKTFICFFNHPIVKNKDMLMNVIENRPKNVPLITVSNHHSCFDDPGIWGPLPWRVAFKKSRMRWSLAAHDICFDTQCHSHFFALAKGVPVIRGNGVYQESINFIMERIRKGEWVHLFPEGKVNETKEDMRLKWGVGRIIFDSPVPPIVIPIWHLGMDNILPNTLPYKFSTHHKLTINYGKPIDFTELIKKLKEKQASNVEARKKIIDVIQDSFVKLKIETEKMHATRILR